MNHTPEPIRRLAEEFLIIVYCGICGLLVGEFANAFIR